MRAIATFVIRLALYAIALGIVARVASWQWEVRGLAYVDRLAPLHDTGSAVLALAPIVLALLGIGPFRLPAVFVAAFLSGAALTAPFAFARLAGV